MPVMYTPDSGYAKEATKWEAQGSTMGPGLRPFVKREYPMMLHLAGTLPQGGLGIIETAVVGHVSYNADGLPTHGADDPHMHELFYARGFRDTPLEALAQYEAEQLEFATLHAEREYEKRHTLSPNAVAEVERVEAERPSDHLPTIPETPVKRRGWPKGKPRKVVA